jgi:hypothetical protein
MSPSHGILSIIVLCITVVSEITLVTRPGRYVLIVLIGIRVNQMTLTVIGVVLPLACVDHL